MDSTMARTSQIRKVKKALQDAEALINDTIGLRAKDGDKDSNFSRIWRAYSKIEYSVALLKLHLNMEEPGALRKDSNNGELSDLLVGAYDHVSDAVDMLGKKRFEETLRSTRKARDMMRNVLIQLRSER